jgi:two-component system NarL family response regulator
MPEPLLTVRVCHAEGILSAGLAALLASCPGIRLAGDPDAQARLADIVVTDYADALARLHRSREGGEKVMIVTQREREWDVRTAMQAGVHGYLPQRCGADELLTAVRALGIGQRYFNQELLARATQNVSRETLTSRESEVLQLLAQGRCNKLIARDLEIGVGTVKTHVKAVFEKLGATARTHAVVLATQRGLVSS